MYNILNILDSECIEECFEYIVLLCCIVFFSIYDKHVYQEYCSNHQHQT